MILDEIAEKTRTRVQKAKRKHPLEEIRTQAEAMNADTGFPFYKALEKSSSRISAK